MTELNDDDRKLLVEISDKFLQADNRQAQYRSRWEHFYSLYRSYHDLRSTSTEPRDKDIAPTMKREFGAELFIPVCFWTIETIVPRMLSQNPRMLILPRSKASAENVENMKALIDAQQDNIDYELILQDVAKNGLIYGLGVQKTVWRHEECMRPRLKKNLLGKWVRQDERYVKFDDPYAESVDPFDFFWSPYATSVKTADFVIHRTWRTTPYVKEKFETGAWDNLQLEDMDISRTATPAKYDEVWAARNRMAGVPGSTSPRGDIHEVWEFHDGKRVVTILDRMWPVQVGESLLGHDELPFQIYRPTRVPGEFCGIGEVEPLEDLQQEINTLRSQRRDNATLVLQKTFGYYEGLVDPADLKFGPGLAIPVNGDPRELLFPIPVGDIPNSSYQEEAALQNDIERTSGIADSVTGAEGSQGGASATATGAQLVHAAAGIRIQNKTRLIEKEVIRPAASQWVAMNQWKIRAEREVRLPSEGGEGAEERWTWRTLTPAELSGEMVVVPEGGSTAPDNTPQMRQDAQMLLTMFANNPLVDQGQLVRRVLKNMGVDQVDSWLNPMQQIPQGSLERIASGIDQFMAHQAEQAGGQAPQGLGQQIIQLAVQGTQPQVPTAPQNGAPQEVPA